MSANRGVFGSILGWVPNWVGFGLIILAGIVAFIYGVAITPSAGLVAFGLAAVISAIVAWVVGGRSSPRINPIGKSFGGTLDHIDGWAWLVVFGLFLVAVLVTVFA